MRKKEEEEDDEIGLFPATCSSTLVCSKVRLRVFLCTARQQHSVCMPGVVASLPFSC